MKLWKKRAIQIFIFMGSIALGVAIILKTFNDNILFFYSPTDIIERNIKPSTKIIRVGGIVKENTINRINSANISFIITDYKNELRINYEGILPNLFKEKQSTVALGYLKNKGEFEAQELLAKHDENYMPKEVADKLNNRD